MLIFIKNTILIITTLLIQIYYKYIINFELTVFLSSYSYNSNKLDVSIAYMKTNKNIEKIKHKNLTWVNITQRTKKETDYLKRIFNFHKSDLRDTLPPLQRPKLIEHLDYLFLVLLFPLYNKKTKVIKPSEVDFFIGKDYVVSVHENNLVPLKKRYRECSKDLSARKICLNDGPEDLLFEILKPLLISVFPLLTEIGHRIDKIEKKIFAVEQKEIIHQILTIKRNIVDFRKTVQNNEKVIRKLITKLPESLPSIKFNRHQIQVLKDLSREIWDYLESYTDTINALHDSHESLATYRLNQIIKTLTIFSVIVFPLTLFAALFGMNTPGMPLTEGPYSFWIIIIFMGIATFGMFYYFKHKKWI